MPPRHRRPHANAGAEVVALFAGLAASAGEASCVNLRTRRDGTLVFADTPDVPLSRLHTLGARARMFGSAAALAVVAACAPKSPSVAPDDFEDDNVDGEVLTPDGDSVSRGRAHVSMFASKRMKKRAIQEPHAWEETAPSEHEAEVAARPAEDAAAASEAKVLVDRLTRRLVELFPEFDPRENAKVEGPPGFFRITFSRDRSWHEQNDCQPSPECGSVLGLDSEQGVVVEIAAWTGMWLGTAVKPIEHGRLRLRVHVEAARPEEAAHIRAATDEVLAMP